MFETNAFHMIPGPTLRMRTPQVRAMRYAQKEYILGCILGWVLGCIEAMLSNGQTLTLGLEKPTHNECCSGQRSLF